MEFIGTQGIFKKFFFWSFCSYIVSSQQMKIIYIQYINKYSFYI